MPAARLGDTGASWSLRKRCGALAGTRSLETWQGTRKLGRIWILGVPSGSPALSEAFGSPEAVGKDKYTKPGVHYSAAIVRWSQHGHLLHVGCSPEHLGNTGGGF